MPVVRLAARSEHTQYLSGLGGYVVAGSGPDCAARREGERKTKRGVLSVRALRSLRLSFHGQASSSTKSRNLHHLHGPVDQGPPPGPPRWKRSRTTASRGGGATGDSPSPALRPPPPGRHTSASASSPSPPAAHRVRPVAQAASPVVRVDKPPPRLRVHIPVYSIYIISMSINNNSLC